MLRATILTGFAFTLASFSATADMRDTTNIADWYIDTSLSSQIESIKLEMPGMNAAQVEIWPTDESTSLQNSDDSSRFVFSRGGKPIPDTDAAAVKPDFGPGPELVAPTPHTFNMFRLR